jgi:CRP/FNR family transcriptional regulator, cyclic AMP receptor protein
MRCVVSHINGSARADTIERSAAGWLIGQLFNSSEKRRARALLLLARYGEPETSHRTFPRVSQETPAKMVVEAPRVELLHEQISRAGVHRVQRRLEDQ